MPTDMELTLEQTQQGVSYEVSVLSDIEDNHGPSDAKLNPPHPLKILYSAGIPVKEILLKLNLPDHRPILRDSKMVVKETKLVRVDMWTLRQTWGNYQFDFVSFYSKGRSGGCWMANDINVMFIVVYAPQIREAGERYGSVFHKRQADAFNLFIDNLNLIDIPLGGFRFTWTDKWASKMSKLDRFLVNNCVFDVFPHLVGTVLEKGVPDHRPILLKESVVDYGPTPFRFFHSWLDIDGFHDLVINSWKNYDSKESNGMVSFKKKLKNLKQVIRNWNASKKSTDNQLRKEHQAKLSLIDNKVDQGIATSHDLNDRVSSLKNLNDIDKKEASDVAQKAKVKWSIEGDENTSFFHGVLKKKQRQISIKGVFKSGDWIKEPGEVKAKFYDHFSNRFTYTGGSYPCIDDLSFKCLSPEQKDSLERDLSNEEIKRAVWDCGEERASGPDGFTFKFFKTFWDTIQPDVVRFVRDFFQLGYFPKGCNSSFIALIPKVGDAKFVSEFRPICLIGCQYKIIGKILANRLSRVIRSCVSVEQTTFIKGRNILDGPLILNECMAWYHKKKKELMVFKVDFEKAYDSLRWDYLDVIMENIGFGHKWRMWISGCLKNARASILVNGSPTSEFEFFKGLRQGDPLAPFLFILAMEGLHASICKAKNVGVFKGVSIGQGVCVSDEDVADMAKVLGCGVIKLPMTFLGVPVGARMLSVGGRLTLLKSVVSNLPTFYMSLYLMPVTVQKQLESMRNRFFLGGGLGEKKVSWVKWNTCLASKAMGGLGIGSIYALNVALLFKWIWRFCCSPNDLWVKVVKGIHGQDGGIGCNRRSNSYQSTWIAILKAVSNLNDKGIDLLSACTRSVGNGKSIRFWDDSWCGDKPLKDVFPRIFALDNDKRCIVDHRINNSTWSTALRRMPRGGIESHQFSVLLDSIRDVMLSDKEDAWKWALNSTGFTVSSARNHIDEHILTGGYTTTRWPKCVPKKVNVFMWRLSLDKLATLVNLDRKGIDVASLLCPVCNEQVENVNHLFFSCEMARDLWTRLARWCQLNISEISNLSEWMSWLDACHILKKARLILEGIVASMLCHLRIEESLKVQDSDKTKSNNIASPSVVNMVEHNNSSRCNDNKGKRKHHDNTRADPYKKAKPTCWKCGKTDHIKRDCKGVNVGSKAKSSGTKGSVDSSSNSLKGAIVHVCKDRFWFKTYELLNDGSILHMGYESTALVHGCGCVDLRLNIVNDNIGLAFMSTFKLNDSILWHARLGHVHFKRMQDMSKDGLIQAFDMDTEKCKTCMLTKITKKPFQNVKRETKVLELIHSDMCDLHATPSLGNKKYFVTFIDDASRFCYVYLLHLKDEALDKFKVFKTEVELQQGSLIKRFKNDRGGLSQGYQGGVMAVVRLSDPKLKNLGERGIECIFVGYVEHSKAFRFFVIEPNELVSIDSIIESKDVIFDENRLSSVPRPSQRFLINGTKDIGGSVVPEEVTKEVVQQRKPELRKSKRNRTPKDFEPEFQL
ncbi:putative RNA-directed DNA polymerase, eukaryota, reverse transcriptase zinc-binding domain protein, partial [Tanacetum coccineum]